jgi:hypothetical protein
VAGLSSNLTSLALRLHPQEVPSDGLWHLADCMTQLQELSLCPLPEACAAADLRQLLEMPRLARLQLGTRDAAQVGGLEAVSELVWTPVGLATHAIRARRAAAAAVKYGACWSRFPCSSAGLLATACVFDGSGCCCCFLLLLLLLGAAAAGHAAE